MSRPNKIVSCIICHKDVHYSKTLMVEVSKSEKVIVRGRACRKHKCVQVFSSRQKKIISRQNLLSVVIVKLNRMRDSYTKDEHLKSTLSEIITVMKIFGFTIRRILTDKI